MGISASDVVPFTLARATLSDLAEQVKAGAEKIITKNGESYVALIDAERLDYYHRLERERIHLLLIDDARRGLADIAAGRTQEADAAIAALQARRAGASQAARRARWRPAGQRANVAEPVVRVELTASFLDRLAVFESFLTEADAASAYDDCWTNSAPPSSPISGAFPASGGAIWTSRRSLPRPSRSSLHCRPARHIACASTCMGTT